MKQESAPSWGARYRRVAVGTPGTQLGVPRRQPASPGPRAGWGPSVLRHSSIWQNPLRVVEAPSTRREPATSHHSSPLRLVATLHPLPRRWRAVGRIETVTCGAGGNTGCSRGSLAWPRRLPREQVSSRTREFKSPPRRFCPDNTASEASGLSGRTTSWRFESWKSQPGTSNEVRRTPGPSSSGSNLPLGVLWLLHR